MMRAVGLLLLAGATQAAGAGWEGQVVRVVDGDTLVVAKDAQTVVTLRVQGIDAPEPCQDWGPQARAALEALVLGQQVRVHPGRRDSYGRLIARVSRDGLDVGERLVREGHAWSDRYRDDKGPYVGKERLAWTLKRGLHAKPGAITPRQFRQQHGPCPPPA